MPVLGQDSRKELEQVEILKTRELIRRESGRGVITERPKPANNNNRD